MTDSERIDQLAAELRDVKVTVTEVREILASFKVALKIAKGCGVLAAAGTAIVAFIVSLKSGWTQLAK